MFDLTIDANIKDFKSFMNNLKTQTSTIKTPMSNWGEYLKQQTNNQFKQGKDPTGHPWKPLAPATLRNKKGTILVETGVMKKSVYYEASARTFQFGIKDPKYQFHHFGTSRMPARVVIGMNDERINKRNELIIAHIRRAKAKSRRKKKK